MSQNPKGGHRVDDASFLTSTDLSGGGRWEWEEGSVCGAWPDLKGEVPPA